MKPMTNNPLAVALNRAQLEELIQKLPKPCIPKDQLEAGFLLGVQYVRALLEERLKD